MAILGKRPLSALTFLGAFGFCLYAATPAQAINGRTEIDYKCLLRVRFLLADQSSRRPIVFRDAPQRTMSEVRRAFSPMEGSQEARYFDSDLFSEDIEN